MVMRRMEVMLCGHYWGCDCNIIDGKDCNRCSVDKRNGFLSNNVEEMIRSMITIMKMIMIYDDRDDNDHNCYQ